MPRDIEPIDPRTLPHREAPRPLHFPVEEFVPESVIHLYVRSSLHSLLREVLAGRAFVGSNQFLYFDGADPNRWVAPAIYVMWGDGGPRPITNWKTWERGTPALCIEIGNSAVEERPWADKLPLYRSMGVAELVCFMSEAEEGRRLRVWDRVDDDLVERVVEGDTTLCRALGMHWVVRAIEDAPAALRLAEDPAGQRLVLDRREADARRIAELEAALRRREGG